MTDNEFKDCLDRYGGDLERWPVALARAGRLLLTQSTNAQAALDEMALIERALSESEPPPPKGLADRIFATAFETNDSDDSRDIPIAQPH